MPSMGWMERAACRGLPTAWWFPETGMSRAPDARRAQSICESCPVRRECLDYALLTEAEVLNGDQPTGIWGGQVAATRRKENRRRRKLQQQQAEVQAAGE